MRFEICEQATNLVPGEGSATAPVVIVGEAPGANEDAQGRPFVGRAGAILDDLLRRPASPARTSSSRTWSRRARPATATREPTRSPITWPSWMPSSRSSAPRLLVPLGRHALGASRPGPPSARSTACSSSTTGGRSSLYHPAAALHNPRLRDDLADDARALRQAL